MAEKDRLPDKRSDKSVAEFLERVKAVPAPGARSATGQGRLLFAMDATASREAAWDRAARIQGEMFQAAAAVGGLGVQLAFYRGFAEFKASRWTGDSAEMTSLMGSVFCFAGETQIRKVLRHAVNETQAARVNALVFVGDACEEDIDRIGQAAGELGLLGVPAFMFHEGEDAAAAFAFREIAKLTRGAYVRFDAGSADALRDLLAAVTVFAAGGGTALSQLARAKGGEALAIARQMPGAKD
ncbi:MAG: VWA domain-containing protein [Rhodospirillales bacterium]|nr:VWA domain-containing protein [Rhodospirillales bacterium]